MKKEIPPASIILCTVPNANTAYTLSQLLLKKHLAACINIIPAVLSLYNWNNKIEQAQEQQLIIKTSSHCFNEINLLLNKNHPYDNPEIIELPITNGSPAYLAWIQKECQYA